jgi:putative tryptophan/tyrosine transport system substrate-binding protein
MRRREFISLFAGAAAAWPLAARGQQALPVVGYLDTYSAESTSIFLTAFRKGLSETGYIEGGNLIIEYRYANNQSDRLLDLAADLVRHKVTVIVTPFGTGATLAAKSVTSTIPIVFLTSADPVKDGLVDSFNRPGGNVTGLSIMSIELGAKRLGLFREVVPGAARLGAVINPKSSIAELLTRDTQHGALSIGWQVDIVHASTSSEIDAAFAALGKNSVDAVFVSADQFFASRRVQFATLATHYRIPAIYSYRAFPEVGCLMSYGPNLPDHYRQLGVYTGRVLKGEKPMNLPVQTPTKFELVINIHTAKTLGLAIPPSLLAIADEVIE